jgi:FkbM family methyltransferase
MKIVHLALTPLAGAPIRLVRALRAHAGVDARLVNLNPTAYGSRRFDEDIDFQSEPVAARALIEAADIVHLHHWIDLAHNPFGVDLRGRVAIRHLHSQPHWVASHGGGGVAQVLSDPLPQLVVAQFHERFYPRARPVPNLLDGAQIDAARAQPLRTDTRLTLCYQPTFDNSALAARWDTKGRPEAQAMLARLARELPIAVDAACDLPHAEALRRKAGADIVLDEMVTGSYHYAGLEGLALGRPTMGYLDARSVATLAALTGSSDLPWVNCHLNDAPTVLRELAADGGLREELGRAGRAWIERHWNESVLVEHYLAAYRDVLDGRKVLRERAPSIYLATRVPDLDWSRNGRILQQAASDALEAPAQRSADDAAAPIEVPERGCVEDGAGLQLRVGPHWFSVSPHWFWPEFIGGWERETEKVYAAFMRPDRDVVDVGAWIGPTAMFALAYGARRVVAIEPNPLSVARLRELAARNPAASGRLIIAAEGVGAQSAQIEFGSADGRLSDSSACSISGRGMRVPVRPLPQILAGIGDLDPALIKIDIEGAEFTIADQIADLSRYVDCAVLISLHPPMRSAGVDAEALLQALQAFDIIDLDAQPLSHAELELRVTSGESHPTWGTRFGNFFEVLLLPRVAMPADAAAPADAKQPALEAG